MKSNLFFLSAAALFSAATAATPTVVLGTAGDYVILSKSGISSDPTNAIADSITGNIGVSPIAATAITGFDLTSDSTEQFSKSTQVTLQVHAASYGGVVATELTAAVGFMEAAYTDAKSRTEDYLNPAGQTTFTTGVYKFDGDLEINDDIIFSGSASEIFIVQIAGDLTLDKSTDVTLTGGAKAENIFWQVAGAVEVRESAKMKGILLVKTKAVFKTGATLTGRVLAQTACTLDGNTITQPAATRRSLRGNTH
jgi:hypothetical protein